MSDWLHRMLDFGNPVEGQVLAFNGTNYEPASLESLAAGLTRPGSVSGTASVTIATTYASGASSPDEIENADLVVDGTDDGNDITDFLDTVVAANANKIIRVRVSGTIRLKTPIVLQQNDSWYVFESAHAWSGAFSQELAKFVIVRGTYTSGYPAFNATGTSVRLGLNGVQVSQTLSAGDYKLTNAYHVYINRCTIKQAAEIYNTPQAGACVFIARESMLSGHSTSPLLRAGWGGDGSSSTPNTLVLKDCTVVNDAGPLIKWDNCAYVDITSNSFSSKDTSPAIYLRQDITDSGATWTTRPPAYRQFFTGNRMLTSPVTPSTTPSAHPFLQLSNIRGMIIADNLATFECLSSSQYYTSTGNFVIIDNYSASNVISNNKFLQAYGAAWDNATPSTDGKYVPARIYLDNTTSNNSVRNSQQVLTDQGRDNDYPIDSYIFNSASGFTVGESPRWPTRKASYLYEAVGTLTGPGSTQTVVDVAVNGLTIGTLTFAAGSIDASTTFESLVAKNDFLTIDITAAGTGAGDMVIAIRGY